MLEIRQPWSRISDPGSEVLCAVISGLRCTDSVFRQDLASDSPRIDGAAEFREARYAQRKSSSGTVFCLTSLLEDVEAGCNQFAAIPAWLQLNILRR